MDLLTISILGAGSACLLAVPITLKRADWWRREQTDGVDRWFEEENLPLILRNAAVVMNERPISIEQPVKLSGRVDQVYQTPTGVLIPVDTKTRKTHTVYSSDIVQLSLYAMILMYTVDSRVSRTGYVRTVVRNDIHRTVRYHPVRLISHRALAEQIR